MQTIEQTLNKYKDLNFVKRMISLGRQNPDRDKEPFVTLEGGRQIATHRMSTVNVDGDELAIPMVVQKGGGELYNFREDVDSAIDYALKTGEFINFGKDINKALNFTKNYKKAAKWPEWAR